MKDNTRWKLKQLTQILNLCKVELSLFHLFSSSDGSGYRVIRTFMLRFTTQASESSMHDSGMADVLHFLEFLRCVFHHQLEAALVFFPVSIVDELVYTASNSTALVRWQHEDL